jgi:hypothetical protein
MAPEALHDEPPSARPRAGSKAEPQSIATGQNGLLRSGAHGEVTNEAGPNACELPGLGCFASLVPLTSKSKCGSEKSSGLPDNAAAASQPRPRCCRCSVLVSGVPQSRRSSKDVGLLPVYVGEDQKAIIDSLFPVWIALAIKQGRGRPGPHRRSCGGGGQSRYRTAGTRLLVIQQRCGGVLPITWLRGIQCQDA